MALMGHHTRVNPPNHSYPRVAVSQRSLAQASQNKTLHHNLSKERFVYTCSVFLFHQVHLLSCSHKEQS